MVNQEYVSDEKIKSVLTYINGLKHNKQIRMMFLCSLNGLRSINFAYLQIKDVFTPDFKVKDVIELGSNKNKGEDVARYFLNKQTKKEFSEYLEYLKKTSKREILLDTYLFCSQKGTNKPFNRVSISRIFSKIWRQFNIDGSSHLGRHLFISKLINAGINPFVVKVLANHKNISTTQKYYNYDAQMLTNAVENIKF